MKKKFRFSRLLAFSAFLIAGCAAYYSVFGLSQLFAGASLAVIIMASSLEFSKIVAVSFLQRYWSRVSATLRNYLAVGVIILVLITSAGIYGFLSNAYQKTATKLEAFEGKVAVLDGKKTLFLKAVNDNQKIIDSKNKRIDQLTNLRLTQEDRLDDAVSSKAKDRARTDIANATKEIQKLTQDIDTLNSKNNVLSDSANVYSTKALESKTGSSIAGEVGPLKYLAQLTGKPMDKIVNYFILLLIFVFDPLAVALVIATNKVMQLEGEVKEDEGEGYPKTPPSKVVEPEENTFHSIDEVPSFVMDEPIIEAPEPIIEEKIEEAVPELVPEPAELTMEQKAEPENKTPTTLVELANKMLEETRPLVKPAPVIPTGEIKVEDIKEKKDINRGFSVSIPPPKKRNNSIEEIK